MDLFAQLREKGIDLRHHRQGEHTTTCPECSEHRKPHNRKKPCLSVRVEADRALWLCHHCGAKGAIFSDGVRAQALPNRNWSRGAHTAARPKPKRWW